MDANDESLARWKASLGIGAGGAGTPGSGPKVTACIFVSERVFDCF